MTEKLNIVQSTTEPDKRNIWLKDNELKKFGAKGWSTIGGSNSSGGNDFNSNNYLYVTIDSIDPTNHVFINNIEYSFQLEGVTCHIKDEHLYNYIKNNIINKNIIVYLTITNNGPSETVKGPAYIGKTVDDIFYISCFIVDSVPIIGISK